MNLFVLLIAIVGVAHAGKCPGMCQAYNAGLSCSGTYTTNLCPGGNDIKCCNENTPSCSSPLNQCQQNNLYCNGTYASNLCPGSNSIECCESTSPGGTGGGCASSVLFTIGGTPIYGIQGQNTWYWEGGLEVDADGSPNAYNPENTGIDYLGNAGSPGNWWGISTDSKGNPYVQGEYPSGGYAPFPGYYVSTTSLENGYYSTSDPRRFANAVNLTFFVLPWTTSVRNTGVKLGDLAYIYHNGINTFAMFADTGPTSQIGEGSVSTHVQLGNNPYNSYGRVVNGIDNGVYTLVFPGSGNGTLLTQQQIDTMGSAVYEAWGGDAQFQKCVLG